MFHRSIFDGYCLRQCVMDQRLSVVNCAEISEPGWRFLSSELSDLPLDWYFYAAQAQSRLERWLTRPNLARFRTCWAAALKARRRPNSVIITHLPLCTLWTAVFSSVLTVKAKHVAFAFNFTELPTGIRRGLMRWAFRRVDRFVVFSRVEQQRYADHFDIDVGRIDFLPWVMDEPRSSSPQLVSGKYICSVGGEGRDYDTLVEAVRHQRGLKTVIVTRSYNMPRGNLPDSIEIYINLSGADFWNVVKHAHAVILPLRNEQTCCGHITLVGALQLGRPVIATRSRGIEDYVREGENALLVPAQDPVALGHAIERLWSDQELYAALETSIAEARAIQQHSRAWSDYFRRYLAASLVNSKTGARQ